MSYNTVRTRIARLEDLFGSPLLSRGSKGVLPTAQGLELQRVALDMKNASVSLTPGEVRQRPAAMNRFRIAATEGLAAVWIVPQLRTILAENPSLEISIVCSDGKSGADRSACDFSVELVKPTPESSVCVRLGYLHLQPFASHDYIAEFGRPADIAEARKHRWVLQRSDQIPQDVSSAFFGDEVPRDRIALVTNGSAAHFAAISSGLGLGVLPNYATALSPSISAIDIGLSFRREVWLLYRPELNRNPSAKKIISWLRACFDQSANGFFAEECLMPDAQTQSLQARKLDQLLMLK